MVEYWDEVGQTRPGIYKVRYLGFVHAHCFINLFLFVVLHILVFAVHTLIVWFSHNVL